MNTCFRSIALYAAIGSFLNLSTLVADSWAVFVYFDGSASSDFALASNWSPENAPGTNLVDTYSIDDGFSATYSTELIRINALRVGSAAKVLQVGETHFGRLTLTSGTLEVIGSNEFGIGRERENNIFGGDYNKNGTVDAADFTVWRDTFGSSTDLRADGDKNGTVEAADYDFWKSRFGNRVKGGEMFMTGDTVLRVNGATIGERTKGMLSVGPDAIFEVLDWNTTVTPNEFGGTVDLRLGNYGPAYDDFGGEPGLDGDGLLDVQGIVKANSAYVSENGGKGEIRLSGAGVVNLNGALHMDFCGNCQSNPALLAQRSSKITINGSGGTFNVGLDPDPLVVDPLAAERDLLAASSTAIFSFTADAAGVTPITLVDNGAELSGTANIAGAQLLLNLDDYLSVADLTLIDAKAGNLVGTFGSVTFLGNRTATVNYDVANGNVFLNNFQGGAGTGALAGAAVPEPSSIVMIVLVGFFLLSYGAGASRQHARTRGYQCLNICA
jgi:hypothetical protein